MFINSNSNKRYYTLDYYFKKKFGIKVVKVTIDGGFTCPNIDGTKGIGGCTYCNIEGNMRQPLLNQYEIQRNVLLKKWNSFKTVAYFHSHTNTYANLSTIKPMFEQVLGFDDVVGICISTRPDCLNDDIVEYLYELAERTFLIVELGLQTIHDITSAYINRCHSYNDFLEGYKKLKNLNVCIHLINGLPNETYEMMIETARAVASLNPHSIKIHSLHILSNTVMEKQYQNNEFTMLTRDEYVQIVCDQIELMPNNTVIQRVTGDGDKTKLIAPLWSNDKRFVLNSIDMELKRRDSFQGKYFSK